MKVPGIEEIEDAYLSGTRNFSLTFTFEQLTALVAEAVSEGRRASGIDPDELAAIVIRALIAKGDSHD